MNLKNLIYTFLMAATILFAGCSEEPLHGVDLDNSGNEGVFSITASISKPGSNAPKVGYSNTKIAFEQGEDLSVKLTWEESDVVNVCFVQGDNIYSGSATPASITNQGRTAEFSFTLPGGISDGTFNVYGIYGGSGLDEDDPTIAFLPNPTTVGSLSEVQESQNMMLYFAAEGIELENPRADVVFKHLGSLFNITFENTGATDLASLDRIDLASASGSEGWAYTGGDHAGRFDLVGGVFLNSESRDTKISFNAGGVKVEAGKNISLWGWFPVLPNVEWPEVALEMSYDSGSGTAKGTNSKPAKETGVGNAYYLEAEWNGTQLKFKEPPLPDIYYVRADGSDSFDGKSWAAPFGTLKKAIETAVDGDEIRVSSGLHAVKNITFNKDVWLRGGFNPDTDQQDYSYAGKSILDADFADRIFNITKSETDDGSRRIDNFIFTNGKKAGQGPAIIQNGSKGTTITNSIFENNENTQAVGEGGAITIHASGSMTLINCLFRNNTSARHGGAIAIWINCSMDIINCTFVGNKGVESIAKGGALYVKGTSDENAATANISNSIFWGNTAGSGGSNEIGAKYSTQLNGKLNMSNNIVKGGTADIEYGVPPVFANSAEVDAADTDPLFVSETDARLSAGSPAINAGKNSLFPEGLSIDLEGKQRFNGVIDLGAYEVQ